MQKEKFLKGSFFIFIHLALLSAVYLLFMPNISRLQKNPKETAFMQYREQEWRKKGQKIKVFQVWVPLSRVSPFLVKAVLIGEDNEFWKHEGFDYDSLMKALEKDLETGRFKFGGSTISQQLVKNLYLSPSKTFWRKIPEAILTWKMERVLSKRRILELYLNVVEWGEGIFGAEAAARHYFQKSASGLTPVEAARLAAVLPNPRKYDPTGQQKYVLRRASFIYNIMVRRGIVPPEYEKTISTSEKARSDGQAEHALVQPPITIDGNGQD
jgi:monofunctional biosynthetic peptidoglycan transglycosylase